MGFPAVKEFCENLSRFNRVTADYKAIPFFSDTVYNEIFSYIFITQAKFNMCFLYTKIVCQRLLSLQHH